ncbi:MAG TPA: c-type cytochrome biogenesis protein CcmI, partial [Burkholderiales bacterium]|nr:c-type cytochrome biogenesis protein CcmI [Burkholderiales bacterium]
MIAFWTISALFVASALLLVVPPLLVQRERTGASRGAINLAIHRDELRALDAEMLAGTLDVKEYARARRELETRVLEDVAEDELAPPVRRRAWATAIGTGLAIPLFALALYFGVGNPQAITTAGQAADAAHGVSPQRMEALVARLAVRMKTNPQDPQGWML